MKKIRNNRTFKRHLLDPFLRKISKDIYAEIKLKLRENLKALVLYGSRIRGENYPDSDLDLLVILNYEDRNLNEIIFTICRELSRKYSVKIDPYVISEDDFKFGCENLFPFNLGVYLGYYIIFGEELVDESHDYITRAVESGKLKIYPRSGIFIQR